MRIIPHPYNFTPLAAMALFGGAHFEQKWHAYIVPFVALLISDAILGFHSTMVFVYAGFALSVWMGSTLKNNISVSGVLRTSLISSMLFFVITNMGVWLMGGLYDQSGLGLAQCFIAAIPFFRTSLLGDLFYSTLLFGSFAVVQRRVPILRTA